MMSPPIILDISRLISRVLHPTPTGVDRVEMAYARGLLANAPDRLRFAAVHPSGRYGHLPHDVVLRFLDRTERRWETDRVASPWATRRAALGMLAALMPRGVPPARPGTVYVQASPHHLTRPAAVQAILRREQARFVCLIHDLIPIEYPEYARPDGADLHLARIRTIAEHADGIIANSTSTLDAVRPFLGDRTARIATRVAHLGVDMPDGIGRAPAGAAHGGYFVCLGTIEPRKNHLLLLNIWRRLSETHGADAIPKLLLIGRRGWENEQVVDMLERCRALRGCVDERGSLSDRDARTLIASAAALLMPSFAEGYGMPVTEALSLGTPVLCSDLPALREAGGDVVDYLDPLDGPAWLDAVLDFARPDGVGRARQLKRLKHWRPVTWNDHMTILHDLIATVAA